MLQKVGGIALFAIGALVSHAYLLLKFLWELLGLPGNYPLVRAGVERSTGAAANMGGFLVALSPFVGGLLMIVAGLVHGRRGSKELTA